MIAVLVTYYGRATSFWQPAPAGSSTDAVLVFGARLGDGQDAGELVSDAGWRVQRSSAWSLPGDATASIEGVPVEILDARELPPRLARRRLRRRRVGAPAVVVRATHIGGLAESRPPTYPFGRLLHAGSPPQVGSRVAPAGVLDASRGRPAVEWATDHPGDACPAGAGGREPLATDPAELPTRRSTSVPGACTTSPWTSAE